MGKPADDGAAEELGAFDDAAEGEEADEAAAEETEAPDGSYQFVITGNGIQPAEGGADGGPGPIAKLLQKEAAERQKQQARLAAERARRRQLSAKRRENLVNNGMPGYYETTYICALRKHKVAPHKMVDHEKAALERVDVEEINPFLRGEDSKKSSGNFTKFLKRNDGFLQERDQILDVMRGQRDQRHMEECTFKPKLPVTHLAASRDRNITALYDKWLENKEFKTEKLQQARQHKLEQEMKECTFKPQSRSGSSSRPASAVSTPRRPEPKARPASAGAWRGGTATTPAGTGYSERYANSERRCPSSTTQRHAATASYTAPSLWGVSSKAYRPGDVPCLQFECDPYAREGATLSLEAPPSPATMTSTDAHEVRGWRPSLE